MDRLWSPWRMTYIDGMNGKDSIDRCFLCDARDARDDREALVFQRRERVFAVLNRFPYNNGHALVVPNAHKGDLAALTDEEMLAMLALARDVMGLYAKVMRADGYNLGLNFGRVAGAGLPGHLHLHLVPRWSGDTNFMAVLADTKVIPQSLEDLYDRLRAAIELGGGAPRGDAGAP